MLVQIAGEHKVMTADSAADCQQVLRHLGEIHPSLPLWRQQRPALHLHSAHPSFNPADPSAHGSLVLRSVLLLLPLENRTLTTLCLLAFVQYTPGGFGLPCGLCCVYVDFLDTYPYHFINRDVMLVSGGGGGAGGVQRGTVSD